MLRVSIMYHGHLQGATNMVDAYVYIAICHR
jgi:hypothetical protein